ncbi:MAG TPA: dephospho-CoA kinase [Gemmataceae bacterium]|nr:dephospho-CoA kinase [Gemmataceae bacterium]
MTPIIGIVGGIGSGKSVVADAMQALGGHLIVADRLGHDALLDPDIKTRLVARWGNAILDDAGNIDRKKVGAIVFADQAELRALESQVFPYIEKNIAEEIARARTRTGVQFIILDAAILLETGWHRHCDKVLYVDAPRDLRLARVRDKRGWTEAELDRREKMQMPLEEKKARADVVIVNDEDFEKVRRQVEDTLVRWKVIC